MPDYHKQFFDECMRFTGCDLKGSSVLVVGCGDGGDCRMFTEAGARVTGLDVAEHIGSAFQNPNVFYCRESVEQCPSVPSDSFDLVFAIATMEHVSRLMPAFLEMCRIAKPGGWIYSVAAPLWNSRQGHHFDCLNPYPWIHLRLGPDQLAEFGDQHGLEHNGQMLRSTIPFLFGSDHFNRLPSNHYAAAAATLPVSYMERNYLWQEGSEYLTPGILSELKAKGYSRDELLNTSHSLVCRK